MQTQIITNFKTSQWSGGTTTELFIYPLDSEYAKRNFIFRLSSATVDLDESNFSDLTGYHRFIAPLEGELKISHNKKDFKSLAINELYAFDGGINTMSQGKCRDFNLMVKNGYQAQINTIHLTPDNPLKININPKEIFWLFSYKNQSDIHINNKDKQLLNQSLEPMTLFVIIPENTEEITIKTSQSVELFYGIIKL